MSWSEDKAKLCKVKYWDRVADPIRNAEIWKKKKGGMSHTQLSQEYGVSRQRINQICRREEYREINERMQKMHTGE